MDRAEIWVVTRFFGVPSEVWMWRQLCFFQRFRPRVVCWGRKDGQRLEVPGAHFQIMPFDPFPENRWTRWLDRLSNLPCGNFFAATRSERVALFQLVAVSRPRAILCHFGHMALRILPIARRHKVPLVAHFHGLDLSSSLNNKWYRWSLKRSLSQFSAIVVVGERQLDWVIRQGVSPELVHLIPCGAVTDQYSRGLRGLSGRTRFITVSRLVEAKGVDHTIRAFAKAMRCLPAAELHIVGSGILRRPLEELAGQLGVTDLVFFHGEVEPEQVFDLLSRADIYVQHSIVSSRGDCEGFGVTVAEASACELPVLATRCGGILDQVVDGETGILVDQQDTDAAASAMVRLANDKDLRYTLGRAGRSRVLRLYDAAAQAKKLEDLLLQVTCAQS